MSVLSTDLIAYSSANMPTTDAATTGGAIDALRRPVFTQLGSNAVAAFQSSSSSDTQSVTVTGRNAAGVITTDTFTLTGTSEKVGTITFERILRVELASAAIGTITAKQGAGGSTLTTIIPTERGFTAMFYDSASDPVGTKTRYEKLFWKNTNGTISLTAASMKLTADPAAKIRIACATAVDDSGSVANRLTLPGGLTFVDDNIAQAVPGNVIAAGSAIGIWVEQALGIGDSPVRNTFTTQLSGQTV